MKNTFYNAFDLESIDHVRRDDYRTPFQADAIIEAIRSKTINRFIADKVGSFIIGCTLAPRENIMSELTNRYK
jgi:hypothetical protein